MKMYKQLRDYLDSSGLLSGLFVQQLQWKDNGKDKSYIVFRPNGGSNLRAGLSNEHYVLVDLVSSSEQTSLIDDLANDIVNYILDNPIDDCLGLIRVMGNIPAPVTTDDGRLVYRLLISITHSN